MFGKVKIGKQEYEMVANAATAYRYRQIFNYDLLRFFHLSALGKIEPDTDVIQKLAFVMIKQAEKADMTKINEEMYIEWLEGLEQADLTNSLTDVVTLYQKTEKAQSKAKNPATQQKGNTQ